jgi:alkylation response protein AidB-like acyl-CoA dehydrogenase
MHLARTEEQVELAAVVRGLLERHSDSAAVRAAAESGTYDAGLWRALCEQVGVAALPVPEEYDGVGASLVETAVVLEEVGRNLAPAPLLASALAETQLLLHGSEDERREQLPGLAAGEVRPVQLDRVVLEPEQPAGSMDQTMRLALPDGPANTAEDVHAVSLALISALQVGAMQRGLEMTVAYSRERVQFGRPIGSFQALKHRMAELLVLVEASRSASWGATSAAAEHVSDPTPERAARLVRLASVASSYCTEALAHVAAETVQLHGGIAITWEHDAQLLFKRAHALNQLAGPAHLSRGELLEPRVT